MTQPANHLHPLQGAPRRYHSVRSVRQALHSSGVATPPKGEQVSVRLTHVRPGDGPFGL